MPYEPADDEIKAMVVDTIKAHHPELLEAKVRCDVLLRLPKTNEHGEATEPGLTLRGREVAAYIKANGIKERVRGLGDALIVLNGERWGTLTPEQRYALIDHELTHLVVQVAKDGFVKTDDAGRPKLKMRQHDWEFGGFNCVLRRHGREAMEALVVQKFIDNDGQHWLPFVDLPKAANAA